MKESQKNFIMYVLTSSLLQIHRLKYLTAMPEIHSFIISQELNVIEKNVFGFSALGCFLITGMTKCFG